MSSALKICGLFVVKFMSLYLVGLVLGLMVLYGLALAVADLIAYCQDKAQMLDSDTIAKRRIDRTSKSLHECAKLGIDYLKFLLLEW